MPWQYIGRQQKGLEKGTGEQDGTHCSEEPRCGIQRCQWPISVASALDTFVRQEVPGNRAPCACLSHPVGPACDAVPDASAHHESPRKGSIARRCSSHGGWGLKPPVPWELASVTCHRPHTSGIAACCGRAPQEHCGQGQDD